MTLALNIIFDTIIVAVIVGMLAWAILTSRPERPARAMRKPRRASRRIPALWPGRAAVRWRSLGSR